MEEKRYQQLLKEHKKICHHFLMDQEEKLIQRYGSVEVASKKLQQVEYQLNYRCD